MKMKLKGIISATAMTLVVSGAAIAQESVRIGVVTPISGTYAPIGQQVRWGLELATRHVNEAGESQDARLS